MKKLLLAILSIILSLGLIFGCKPSVANSPLTEENLEAVNNMYDFATLPDPLNEQAFNNGKVIFPNSLFTTPATFDAQSGYLDVFGDGTVSGLFLESVNNSSGTPTRIFAYYGLPASASAANPVPATVLVHGAGATASANWVREWNSRGYAAISIDTDGTIPNVGKLEWGAKIPEDKTITGLGGPQGIGFQLASNLAVEQQFLYHAVAATIVANSFLRSQPQIINTKIGLSGVSWGGHISSIAVGYDNRYAFCVPIYGALQLNESFGQFGPAYRTATHLQFWSSTNAIKLTQTPILFINGANDDYFSLDSTTRTSQDTPFALKSVIYGLTHAGGRQRIEQYKFANSVVKGTQKLIRITTNPVFGDRLLKYQLPTGNTIAQIRLLESDSPNPTYALAGVPAQATTIWTSSIVGSRNRDDRNNLAIIELKPTTQMFYVEIEDADGCIVSSDLARLI